MNSKTRAVQKAILNAFSNAAEDFALAGGTALELYYLQHRFSADLDFFSPKYSLSEINHLISAFQKRVGKKIKLESGFTAQGKAQVRFYTCPVSGSSRSLKIDFIEDIFFKKPKIRKFDGVRVYDVENIYLQKIAAIAGTEGGTDEVGKPIFEGRNEARDAFDVYMLSQRIQPLHQFLRKVPPYWQKGMVHWYRTFSRQEFKLTLIDMAIYEKQFDSGKMIRYLENEIKRFAREVIGT